MMGRRTDISARAGRPICECFSDLTRQRYNQIRNESDERKEAGRLEHHAAPDAIVFECIELVDLGSMRLCFEREHDSRSIRPLIPSRHAFRDLTAFAYGLEQIDRSHLLPGSW
jgi:hypothetical protein